MIAASSLSVILLIWWGSTTLRRRMVIWIPRRNLGNSRCLCTHLPAPQLFGCDPPYVKSTCKFAKIQSAVETAIDQLPAASRLSLISSGGWLPAFTPWGKSSAASVGTCATRLEHSSTQPFQRLNYWVYSIHSTQNQPQQFTANCELRAVEYLVLEMFFGFEEADRLLPYSDWLRTSGEAELMATDPRVNCGKILLPNKFYSGCADGIDFYGENMCFCCFSFLRAKCFALATWSKF